MHYSLALKHRWYDTAICTIYWHLVIYLHSSNKKCNSCLKYCNLSISGKQENVFLSIRWLESARNNRYTEFKPTFLNKNNERNRDMYILNFYMYNDSFYRKPILQFSIQFQFLPPYELLCFTLTVFSLPISSAVLMYHLG